MEKQLQSTELTKDKAQMEEKGNDGVFLNGADAEEFRAYKKKKRISEIAERIARSEGSLMGAEDVQRVCERARRLKQKAVQLPLTKMSLAKYYLSGSAVEMDCVIGGTGETLAAIKAYEAKRAVKGGAKEITLNIAPSYVDGCRFAEIRKEIRRVKRAAKKASVKVAVEKECSATALSRAARVAAEAGASYFCVSYFAGCEKLRMDLTGLCKLQVSGVPNAAAFQRLADAGVGRIVTDNAWEIYNEWMKEETPLPVKEPVREIVKEKPIQRKTETGKPDLETLKKGNDYHCRLEGTELKFF